MGRHIVIIGGGAIGSAVAAFLSGEAPDCRVSVVERIPLAWGFRPEAAYTICGVSPPPEADPDNPPPEVTHAQFEELV